MPEQLKAVSGGRRINVDPSEATLAIDTGLPGTYLTYFPDALTFKNGALYHANITAAGSRYTWSIYLTAGTYDLNLITLGNYLSAGNLEWFVDGVSVLFLDPTTIGGAYNQLSTQTGIVIPTSGNHLFELSVPSKPAPNTGYEVWVDAICFAPATD